MGKVIVSPGKKEYPDLDTLVGGYFHQDYSIHGETLEEILAEFKADATHDPEALERVRRDIAHFLLERPDDREVADDFVRMFMPDVIVEGWDGLTTRQWLMRVSELLLLPASAD